MKGKAWNQVNRLDHTIQSFYNYACICEPIIIHVLYKCEAHVGCRDDTVPKTVDTRRHCEED